MLLDVSVDYTVEVLVGDTGIARHYSSSGVFGVAYLTYLFFLSHVTCW